MLQKIEHVCGSVSLDDQGHSPSPRGEDLLQQLYACDGVTPTFYKNKIFVQIKMHIKL
jgi:hypothetical protein